MTRFGPHTLAIPLLLLLLTQPLCAQEGIGALLDPGLPPLIETLIEEPVFEGTARIYEFNRGAQEAVVLVHGINGGGLRDFANQIPALARRYHVITFDLPGFGESERKNALYSPENYVRFIRFVTESRTRGPFHLVGHSMGGAIALAYAAGYPEEVRRLVAIDVAGILHRVTMGKFMATRAAAEATGTDPDGVVGKIAGKLMEDLGKFRFNAERVLSNPRARDELGGSSAVAGMALLEEDFGPILPRVKAPTLLLWGRDDPIAPLRTGIALRALIADARLEVIDGVGHVPMREAPVRVTDLATEFLASAERAVRVAPPLVPRDPQGRVGRCEDERGRVFEGSFEHIELRNCSGVIIRNARVERLTAFESRADIIDSELRCDGTTLIATGSELRITASTIVGRTAIESARSSIDVAASRIVGTDAAVRSNLEETSLVFSVSTVDSPLRHGPIHTFVNLEQGAKF